MDKSTLERKLEALKKPREELLKEFSEAAKTTLPDEVGLKHPSQNVGVHVRDDGSLELFAGDCKIILDGETGSIVIVGNHLVTSTSDANINLAENNSFAINNIPLNSRWLDYGNIQNLLGISTKGITVKSVGPRGEIPDLSPVTFKEWQGGASQFLTGAPAAGQRPVKFSDVFNSKPLFNNPTATEFLSAIKSILKGVL